MRRVVITGMGAVTPLGNSAADDVAGCDRRAERRRLHPDVRLVRVPRTHRRRGQGRLRPERACLRQGDETARPQHPVRALGGEGGARRRRHQRLPAGARGRRPRLRYRRAPRAAAPVRRSARARSGPGLPVVHAERPPRLGERPGGDRARDPGTELRGRLGLRDRVARDRRRRRSRPPRLRRRGRRGRHRGVHPSAVLRGLLLHAGSRRRGGRPGEGLPAVRCDARGVRDGRGRRNRHARGVRAREGARRDDLRRDARLRGVERRLPHGRA